MTQRFEPFQRNHVVLAERIYLAAAQSADVPKRAERPAEVASERAYVSALAAFGCEHGMIRIRRFEQIEPIYGYRARGDFDRRAVPRQVVSPLAVNLYGRKARRHLFDRSDKARQQSLDRGRRGAALARVHDTAFGIVGVAFLTPSHGEGIGLSTVDHEGNGLGRLAERDRQTAG